MSLADELLADLEGAGDDREGDSDDDDMQIKADPDAIDEIEEVMDEDSQQDDTIGAYERVTSVARLSTTPHFQNLMKQIEEGVAHPRLEDILGPVEADPEYRLVVEVNKMAVEIDNELHVIHKFVRDKYAKRFPELESLVPSPLEYLACVRELGNEVLAKAANRDVLSKMLLPATVIVVSVTASTTQGTHLTDSELAAVNEACEMASHLQEMKMNIFTFVEQRMSFIAPNLSTLIGSGTAAMLIGHAGGLAQLSKMPSCNILVLGSQKRTLAGFSSTAVQPHTGYLFYTTLVQRLPPDLRRRAARQLSGKVALAARVDTVHASRDGSVGQRFGEDVASKFEKWLEPPPTKAVKPLPKPIDKTSKKRGGRRVRKMKERLGLTEMRKKANRVTFAVVDEDIEQMGGGFNRGQLKAGGGVSGSLRAPQIDQKSRVKMSKMLQKQVHRANAAAGNSTSVTSVTGMRTAGSRATGGGTAAGTSTSIAFTPVQGLEIVNPNALQQKANDANNKYFAPTAGFMKVNVGEKKG